MFAYYNIKAVQISQFNPSAMSTALPQCALPAAELAAAAAAAAETTAAAAAATVIIAAAVVAVGSACANDGPNPMSSNAFGA